MLLSEHVINGNIDLVPKVFEPELSEDEDASGKEVQNAPEIFNPNLLMNRLAELRPSQLESVNK